MTELPTPSGPFTDAAEARARILLVDAQRRLRLYEAALSNTPDLVYVFDLDHRFIYANVGLLKMWGKTWDEAIGKNCLELGYEPWHAAMHDREIEQVIATKQPIKGEVPFTGTFGRRIYEYIFVPVLSENGTVEAVAGTTRDVTELSQAVEQAQQLTEQLSEQAERFVRFMQHLPGLAWIKDDQGRYTFANDAAMKAFGRPRCDVYGKTDTELFPLETATQFQQNDRLALESGIGVQVVETLKHEDGVHHSIVSKFPIPGRDGKPTFVGGVAIDITDLKKAEEALRDADRRKDEFLATLAHELRNPLAPIRNSLHILKMPAIDAKIIERSREMMERQVHHLVRLVDDLLDVSRVMRGKIELRKEQIDLATVVARAVETVQPLIDAHEHQLTIQLPKEALVVEVDPVRMTQVIGNLLTNAAKYSENGGRIWLNAQRRDGSFVLSVRDAGIGIASDMIAQIFELFVQADHTSTKAQGGLGVGLTLVKNLVEMHGGTVEARSGGLGQGSEFILRFPIAAHDEQ